MGYLRDKALRIFNNKKITYSVTIQKVATENSVDFSGTPISNPNYGKIITGTATKYYPKVILIPINAYNSTVDGNQVKYTPSGYKSEDTLIMFSIDKVQNQDIVTHPNGQFYEVLESDDFWCPDDNGLPEFVYCICTIVKQENQSIKSNVG